MEKEPELLKIDSKMREALNAPLPAEAITQHPTKTYLSTIKAIYIVERLNDVFGLGRWDLITEVVDKTSDYILMRGKLMFLDYDVALPLQYGGHQTTGKGVELADGYKSAVTDCLSKCASYLEIGLDVFKGKQNGKAGQKASAQKSPYQAQKTAQKPPATALPKTTVQSANPSQILFILFNELKLPDITQDRYKLYCYHKYGITSMNQLRSEETTEQKNLLKDIAKSEKRKTEFKDHLLKVTETWSVPKDSKIEEENIRIQIRKTMSQIYGKNQHMIDDKISAMTMDGTHDLDSMAVNELKGVLDCVKISWDEFQETLKNNMAKSAF
ncbi:MAG TPA: hypothetical protein VMV36_00815 [Ignavibacteriaceae bacterium]|nr:hypothetical protein [Ignavibacteriaceae bacterium]